MSEPPEEEPQFFDGPDPREWMGRPEFIRAVQNVETIDALIAALKGPIAQEGSAAYREALRLLTILGYQARYELSVMVLKAQGVPVPEEDDGDSSPFSGAGKPRAFGAEPAPPPATP